MNSLPKGWTTNCLPNGWTVELEPAGSKYYARALDANGASCAYVPRESTSRNKLLKALRRAVVKLPLANHLPNVVRILLWWKTEWTAFMTIRVLIAVEKLFAHPEAAPYALVALPNGWSIEIQPPDCVHYACIRDDEGNHKRWLPRPKTAFTEFFKQIRKSLEAWPGSKLFSNEARILIWNGRNWSLDDASLILSEIVAVLSKEESQGD